MDAWYCYQMFYPQATSVHFHNIKIIVYFIHPKVYTDDISLYNYLVKYLFK